MTEVLLAESAEDIVLRAAISARPIETGGLLLGVWSQHRPWISHVIEIPPQVPSPNHYVLPAGLTHPLVACARRVDRRLGYLGEWHVHPADAGPSPTDGQTMRRLSFCSATPPILLLARFVAQAYIVEAHTWSRRRRIRLMIIRTGDLPPPA